MPSVAAANANPAGGSASVLLWDGIPRAAAYER
jgi:hypothetical protein